jgi:hypothetical protein
MSTTKKNHQYKISLKGRGNMSEGQKGVWARLTDEERAERLENMRKGRAKFYAKKEKKPEQFRLNLNSKQKEVVAKYKEIAASLPPLQEPTPVTPEELTPMQKNLEILRERVGKRVGFEVNLEQAIEFLVNKWGVQQL